MIVKLALLGCALLVLGCKSHADEAATAPTPQSALCRSAGAVDVLSHDVRLDVEVAPASLRGHGTLKLRAREQAAAIWLDVQDLEVRSVEDPQGFLTFETQPDKLCIRLRRPLEAAEELDLELAWRARDRSRGLHIYPDQIWAGYNTPAWMPTRQDPAQRARLKLFLHAPPGYAVVASGGLNHLVYGPEEEGVHRFTLDVPTPPFLYAFVVGKLSHVDVQLPRLNLRVFGPEGTNLSAVLQPTAAAAKFLFDVTLRSPLGGYTQVFVHGDAAQEAAGMALLSDASLQEFERDPSADWIFTHELAHQWFGVLVPCADFSDFWLNEGFATFCVGAVQEQQRGRSAYDAELARWRARSAEAHAQHRDAPVALSRPGERVSPPTEAQLQARGITYFRGALVLHRLREQLGDDVFWLGVRRYVSQMAGHPARTEDLRAALEAESHRDLGPFFTRWVYTAAPDL